MTATLYHHGTILTMEDQDRRPEALVVRDGIIVYVGSLVSARALVGPEDEEVDLDGATLMPSFIDPHGHLLAHGMMTACVDLEGARSIDDMIAVLSERLSSREPEDTTPLIGVRYDPALLAEGRHPTRHDLDQVTTEVPVFVLHRSVHMGVGSSLTLERCGITGQTPDPDGGRFGREPGGTTPDGYIEELSALAAVREGLPSTSGAALIPGLSLDPLEAVRGAQEEYLRHGITTAQEGAADPGTVASLAAAADAGALELDLVAYPLMSIGGQETMARHSRFAGEYVGRLRMGGYKIVLDGSPQARSAWMSRPYEQLTGQPGEAGQTEDGARPEAPDGPGPEPVGHCECGYPALPDEDVEGYVRAAVAEGRQLIVHCNGDAAAEQWISTLETVAGEHPEATDLRPVMIHAQTVRPDQIARMVPLRMIASVFAVHVYFWGDVHMKNLGPERGRRISPSRTALDAGLTITLHQDAPVTPPDMLLSLWSAVNRISRTGKPVGLEQRISTWEALRAVTADAAYQYGEEESKGTLAEGKRADLVILDRDPLTTPPQELRDIAVLRTIKDGKVVYSRNVC